MKRKLATFAFALALSFLAAPVATAWDKVCAKAPVGKAWMIPQLHVVSHFPAWDTRRNVRLEDLPGVANGETYYNDRSGSRYDYEVPSSFDVNPWVRASGPLKRTGNILAGQSKCLDISDLPEGTAFFAYVSTTWFSGNRYGLCSPHSSNPFRYYLQTERPYREMWYETTGVEWSPKCEFTHEK